MSSDNSKCTYDVCLSFASEDREYVESVASEARSRNVHVFYDKYEQVELWGKNLYDHLADVYQNRARFCVIFISEHYRGKLWTNHERKHAQARAFQENKEYLLPVRFDSTEIPGLPDTIGYIDAGNVSPAELAQMIEERVMPARRSSYFPELPTRLFGSFDAESIEEQSDLKACAEHFFESLKLTGLEERKTLFTLFLNACPAELPDNVHISQDLLSRMTGFTIENLKNILGNTSSLGFFISERDDEEHEHLGDNAVFVLQWYDMRVDGIGQATPIADEAIRLVAECYCTDHAVEALTRLDFSALQELGST